MWRTTVRSATSGSLARLRRSRCFGSTGPALGTSLAGKVAPRWPLCDLSNIVGSGMWRGFLSCPYSQTALMYLSSSSRVRFSVTATSRRFSICG